MQVHHDGRRQGGRIRSAGRRAGAVLAGVAAVATYAADLLGLKPPPRVIPSIALAVAAIVLGVPAEPRTGPAVPRAVPALGLALQALAVLPFLAIGLVAPPAGALAVHLVWVLGFALAWRWRRSRPWLVLAVPFASTAGMAAMVWLGATLWHWQA